VFEFILQQDQNQKPKTKATSDDRILSAANDNMQPETAYPKALAWIVARAPRLRWLAHFSWRLAVRWGEDQCPLKAAAMAFFGFLSIFPIILAAVTILATILAGNVSALAAFQSFVKQFFPGQTGADVSAAMRHAVGKIAGGTSVTTVSLIALASLLWSGRAFFATLADVLSAVWPRSRPRSFWRSQLVLWSTFVVAGALWLVSTAATFALEVAVHILQFLPQEFRNALPWVDIVSRLTSWLLTIAMFWLIYRFLPNVEGGRRRIVWGAAILAAFGWELSKWGFTKFLGNLDRFEATYGSVAGVVLTLMWIYVSSMIVLLGAEAAAAFEETCSALPAMPCPTPTDHAESEPDREDS
jgi:membrane protein